MTTGQTASVSAITYRFSEKFSRISGTYNVPPGSIRFRTHGLARVPGPVRTATTRTDVRAGTPVVTAVVSPAIGISGWRNARTARRVTGSGQ